MTPDPTTTERRGDEIDRMTPRELDAAVAVEVMGYRWMVHKPGISSMKPGHRFLVRPDYDEMLAVCDPATGDEPLWNVGHENPGAPPYSTDPAAAWQVVEKMTADGAHLFAMSRDRDGRYFVEIEYHGVYADTAPLAICRAALRAARSATAPATRTEKP